MRSLILALITLVLPTLSYGQGDDIWLRFTDPRNDRIGYKDLNGRIRIPARFEPMTRADTFYNIIAVQELINDRYAHYYLLKSGQRIGHDSVFMNDYIFDCESEGKILFKDQKKDRIGYFSKNGRMLIPAIYNYAQPFHNGVAVALRNAKRTCWGKGEDTSTCEHLSWEGGQLVLINDRNELLADSLKIDPDNIDWYSMQVNAPGPDTGLHVQLQGTKGATYSFVDFQKEFTRWFYAAFLPALDSGNNTRLKGLFMPRITYWSKAKGWTSLNKDAFLTRFPTALTKVRFRESAQKKMSIFQGGLNPYTFSQSRYRQYYNACGEHNRHRYPLFDVMLSYYKKRVASGLPLHAAAAKTDQAEFEQDYELDYQEHFEFLKTTAGYKLLAISIIQ